MRQNTFTGMLAAMAAMFGRKAQEDSNGEKKLVSVRQPIMPMLIAPAFYGDAKGYGEYLAMSGKDKANKRKRKHYAKMRS